ncbi:MAG: hypothetical protein GF381_01400 [Candidatus Pacebacteria bacterium]|nr:hypothetical protein [Candidatus Paceibacterota bacterium]
MLDAPRISKTSWIKRIKLLFVGFLILERLLLLAQPTSIQAATGPFSETKTLSATVVDNVPPSTPILISPANNSIVSTNKPEFVWMASTDNMVMSHYQLWIDGSLYLDNLATEGNFTNYELEYDPSTTYYHLQLKNSLAQDSHTWKIVAFDQEDNQTDSATWTFIVDSIAPTFVLTDIGDHEVSISAQDTSTIPSSVFQLDDNEPVLVAQGEALSTVELTLIIPDEDNPVLTKTIDSNGNWSYTLPLLTRGKIITLRFIITDKAGHIVALEGVKILIKSPAIVIPAPSSTPTPTPTLVPGVSAPVEPTLAPGQPTPSPLPPAVTPRPKKPITIPYTPPKEVVHQIIRTYTPTPILRVTQVPWIQQLINLIGPWLAALLMLLVPVLATLMLAKDFGKKLSWQVLVRIWRVLGIIPNWQSERWQGAVFASGGLGYKHEFGEVPFAQISFISQDQNTYLPPTIETTLTNSQGFYPPLELPPDLYRASVRHPDFRFPSNQQQADKTEAEDFYQGEVCNSEDQLGLSLFIPVDNLNPTDQSSLYLSASTKLKLWLASICQRQSLPYWGLLSLSGLITLFYPSPANLSLMGVNGLFLLDQIRQELTTPNISGIVVDSKGDPLPDVFIRVTDQTVPKQSFVTRTNSKGKFGLQVPRADYSIKAVKPGHQLVELGQELKISTQTNKQHLALMMRQA